MTGLLQLSSAVVDLVWRIPALPPSGGEALAHDMQITPGGGFNACQAARRAGIAVAYGGTLGTGPFADIVRAALAAEGIACLLPPGAEDQGSCVVLVEDTGERSFICKEGGQGRLTAAMLRHLSPAGYDAVLLTGYALVPEANRAVLAGWVEAQPPAMPLTFDPSPIIAALPEALRTRILARCHWVSCNAAEAGVLTGEGDPTRAATTLLSRLGPEARGVVVRCGASGAVLAEAGGVPVRVPGFTVPVVDTTGAGDCHVAVFLAALAAGEDPLAAVTRANAAAALSVTRAGPATAPMASETDQLLRASRRGSVGAADNHSEKDRA